MTGGGVMSAEFKPWTGESSTIKRVSTGFEVHHKGAHVSISFREDSSGNVTSIVVDAQRDCGAPVQVNQSRDGRWVTFVDDRQRAAMASMLKHFDYEVGGHLVDANDEDGVAFEGDAVNTNGCHCSSPGGVVWMGDFSL